MVLKTIISSWHEILGVWEIPQEIVDTPIIPITVYTSKLNQFCGTGKIKQTGYSDCHLLSTVKYRIFTPCCRPKMTDEDVT